LIRHVRHGHRSVRVWSVMKERARFGTITTFGKFRADI